MLDLGATEVGAELPVGADDPMAGDDYRQRVGGARGADGPHGLGVVHCGSHGLVAGRLPVADGRQIGQHRAAEAGREPQVERQVEAGAPPGEVLLELAGDLVEPPGGSQDPGADPVRQTVRAPCRGLRARTRPGPDPVGVAASSSVPTGVSRVR